MRKGKLRTLSICHLGTNLPQNLMFHFGLTNSNFITAAKLDYTILGLNLLARKCIKKQITCFPFSDTIVLGMRHYIYVICKYNNQKGIYIKK